jgi:phage terminase large subunit
MVEINEVYKPLYTSKKRYFFVTGGRGSLKSTSVHDFVQRLTYELGHGVLFTRYTMTAAEKSIIPEFKIVAQRNGSINDFKFSGNVVTNKITGSFILFSGIKTSQGDQTANLKSIAGITTWIIDEGEDFNDEVTFDDIDDSVRIPNIQNRVIWIQNPSTKEHFIYDRWIAKNPIQKDVEGFKVTMSNHQDVEHIHTTYHIAKKFLNQSFLDKAETQRIENPKRYYHKYIGGWLEKAEGVIYEDWITGEFPEHLPSVHGLDFGSNDPDALTEVVVDENKKKIYIREKYFQNNTSFDGLAQVLSDRVGWSNLIIADNAERRLIKDYFNMGFNIRKCHKGKVKDEIQKIQDYQLIVCPKSINLQKALNNYRWHDKKSGLPNHDWSDLCDSFRYAAMYVIRGQSTSIEW